MFSFIKSLFTNEQIISNIHVIDDVEDKYDVLPLTRLYVQCNACKRMKHISIKCC